ncbi:MAG: nucleoside-diphosphate kinase [Flavobacteriales bacterium Tduv]
MSANFTLAMLKPDTVSKGYVGPILSKITEAGFKIRALKMTAFSTEDAQRFYEKHRKCLFFDSLVTFMSSGPIVAVVLEKENAIEDFRTLIGVTDPEKTNEDTIRRLYAESVEKNAVHGSDSEKNALKEILFHFTRKEILLPEGLPSPF